MPIKINLIKNRHTLSEAEYQRERTYFRMSLIAMAIVTVITLAAALWQFVLTTQLNSIETSVGKSTKQLQGLSQASAKQIYLKSRLKLITAFLDDRSVARQSLQNVFSIQIPGVAITGASFESDNILKISASASNVIVLSHLVDYLSTDDGFFLQAVSRGISRSPDGSYQMDLALTIPKS